MLRASSQHIVIKTNIKKKYMKDKFKPLFETYTFNNGVTA